MDGVEPMSTGRGMKGAMESLCENLMDFPNSFSDRVADDAALVVADTVMCAFAADAGKGGGVRDRDQIHRWAGSHYERRAALRSNATLAHHLELDPVNFVTRGHAGVVMVPALSALVDRHVLTRDQAFCCLITATEVMAFLGQAWGPRLTSTGVHATAYLAPAALCAAVAKCRTNSSEAVAGALLAALALGAGATSSFGTRLKARQVARAAELVIELVEDPPGPARTTDWINEMAQRFGDPQADWITESEPKLGREFVIDQVPSMFKMMSTCAFFADTLARVASLPRLCPSEVLHVDVDVPADAANVNIGRMPASADEVPFSLQYSIACLIKAGRMGQFRTDRWLHDPEVAEMVPRINVHRLDGDFRYIDSTLRGKLVVQTHAQVIEETVVYQAIPPVFTEQALEAKWHGLAVDMGIRVNPMLSALLQDVRDTPQTSEGGWFPRFYATLKGSMPH